MKKYIINERQLKHLILYQKLNEDVSTANIKITHENGKIKINDQKYKVVIQPIGEIFIEDITPVNNGYSVTAKKDFAFGISKTEKIFLAKKRVDDIIKQIPSDKITSVGDNKGRSFDLIRIKT